MEHFEELQKKIKEKEHLDEIIKRVSSIYFMGNYGMNQYIGFQKNDSDRWTFSTVIKIIGKEKAEQLLEQFKGLIEVELFKKNKELENDLSQFKIIKN